MDLYTRARTQKFWKSHSVWNKKEMVGYKVSSGSPYESQLPWRR